jgi:3-oxoacyl-[acyl-carrier protein] reductase
MKLLEKKRALITGGSRGLGRALCAQFSLEGADVAFNYSSDESGAQETTRLIEGNGRAALSFKVSVLDSNGLNQMVKEIERTWEQIDILVNNAGVSQPLPIALMEESDWDSVMDINAKGQFLMARAALKGMIRRKSGTILNIGSLAGLRLLEAPVHYSASKAAVKGFTEALSKEVARYNIRVNCLAPGLLEEGVAQNLPEHRLKEYLKHVALHRTGTAKEVATFATFLVSDRNSYMNGATIIMDGGL